MPALKHAINRLHTPGGQSKFPVEEHNGRNAPRKPGGGRKRKDGSDPVPVPAELRPLLNRRGNLPKALLAGPPSAEQMAAFVTKWGGEFPEGKLNPVEALEEAGKPILSLDLKWAMEVADMVRAGHHPVWLKRNWPRWPGDRTWMSWRRSDEFERYYQDCLNDRQERSAMAAQDAIDRAPEELLDERISTFKANAWAGLVHRRAEHARGFAAMHSREKYGDSLQVNSTVSGNVSVQVGSDTALLRELRASLGLGEMKVIEGEVER